MPIGSKTSVPQPLNRALREITVLEAAAGKNHSFLTEPTGNRDHAFDQSVVEFGRNDIRRNAFPDVGQQRVEEFRPVQDEDGVGDG